MIDKTEALPVAAQCRLLNISRGCVYYKPVALSELELRQMRSIDQLHLEHPFYGSRRLLVLLRQEGFELGRLHVRTLMRRMGIEALYRKPRTSLGNQAHRIYPYLLKDVAIERPNQAWASDITYIPMARGFGYLVAIIDLYSRKELAHRLSNTMTTDFCVEALEEAITRFGAPEIFNTDQGAQFTDTDFTDILKKHDIAISMDGKRRWIDNVFIERLWRSVKYEEVYLKAYESLSDARTQLRSYFSLYNERRPHQSHGYRTPDAVYFEALDQRKGGIGMNVSQFHTISKSERTDNAARLASLPECTSGRANRVLEHQGALQNLRFAENELEFECSVATRPVSLMAGGLRPPAPPNNRLR